MVGSTTQPSNSLVSVLRIEFCSHRGIKTEFHGYRTSDFDGNFDPKHMVDVIGVEHAPYGEEHVRRCFSSGMRRPGGFSKQRPARPARPAARPRPAGTTAAPADSKNTGAPADNEITDHPAANSGRQHHPKADSGPGDAPDPAAPVCMTDGSTLANMKIAYCLLKSTKDKGTVL